MLEFQLKCLNCCDVLEEEQLLKICLQLQLKSKLKNNFE